MEKKNSYIDAPIIENIKVSDKVYKMTLEGNFEGKAGQFYMLRMGEMGPFLSRPLSICDIDDKTITFLYLVVGSGTKLMSELKKGDRMSLLGPLGHGFKIEEYKKVAIVSGGIGIAPLLKLCKKLNCHIDFYAGFRDESYFLDEIKPFVSNIYISSDSGKEGTKGNVLSIYKDQDYNQVYACGPNIMLKSLKENTDSSKLQVSLEAHMACGLGACLGCAVNTKRGIERICKEGPVFVAEEVELNA